MNKEFKFQEFWSKQKIEKEEKGPIARSFHFNRPTVQPSTLIFSPHCSLRCLFIGKTKKIVFSQRLKSGLGVIKGRKATTREGQHS